MAASEKKYLFRLRLSRRQFISYYQGTVSSVQVYSECGRSLRFPAHRLRSFLTANGISGRFALTVDRDNRFVRMEKVGELPT